MSYEIQRMVPGSTVLWNGAYPCSLCNSKLHSRYEPNAKAWVCAGCYNEFALEKGWEKE
jgi:ribosomal protein L37AE/L43A